MNATSFDPLETTRDLEAAGIERRQAEAIAGAMRRAATADHAELATKADVAVVKADVAVVKADVAALRSEMRWMFGFQAAVILAMAAKLFGIV